MNLSLVKKYFSSDSPRVLPGVFVELIMKKTALIIAGIIALFIIAALIRMNMNQQQSQESNPPQEAVTQKQEKGAEAPKQETKKNGNTAITLETSKGSITFETYDADAPRAVANFTKLAKEGFYSGLIFHRVIRGFMIQGGDPKGDGTGGPGYSFEDELNPATDSYKAGYKKGVVAMANAGPNTNGSQFFIMLEDYPLPNNYTIFGKVTSGQEVVDAIGVVKTSAGDKPLEDVKIKKVTVVEKK